MSANSNSDHESVSAMVLLTPSMWKTHRDVCEPIMRRVANKKRSLYPFDTFSEWNISTVFNESVWIRILCGADSSSVAHTRAETTHRASK